MEVYPVFAGSCQMFSDSLTSATFLAKLTHHGSTDMVYNISVLVTDVHGHYDYAWSIVSRSHSILM